METSRILNSIGKEIFIIYYFIFKNSITTDIVKILIKDGVSNEAGARIRVGNAKKIFNNNLHIEALQLIINSNRISYATKEKAKRILLEEI